MNKGKNYEIYLMPEDKDLIDIFLMLDDRLNFDVIAFIALSLRQDVIKSVGEFSAQILPRIIISLKEFDDEEEARVAAINLIRFLKSILKQYSGIGYKPRFSAEIPGTKKLIYVGFGSGDYKESEAGGKAYKDKSLRAWLWSWIDSKEYMAYQKDSQRIVVPE
jgi:hypothetical protein